MTPHYFSEPTADYYWVGFTNSFEDQGVIDEEFMSKGGAIQKAFDEIEVCSSRSQYMWSLVRDTFAEPISGGFVDFARCSLQGGAGMNDLAAADANAKLPRRFGNTTNLSVDANSGYKPAGCRFHSSSVGGVIICQRAEYGPFINAGGIEQQAAIYGAVVNCVDGPSANYVSVGGSE